MIQQHETFKQAHTILFFLYVVYRNDLKNIPAVAISSSRGSRRLVAPRQPRMPRRKTSGGSNRLSSHFQSDKEVPEDNISTMSISKKSGGSAGPYSSVPPRRKSTVITRQRSVSLGGLSPRDQRKHSRSIINEVKEEAKTAGVKVMCKRVLTCSQSGDWPACDQALRYAMFLYFWVL